VQNTPANVLKIDRSFVQGISDSGVNISIVRSMLQLASSLGMEVVAEGIESRADGAVIRDLGAQFGQGYAFGVPQSIVHSAALVRRWRRPDIASWKFVSIDGGKRAASVA
jgi:EAL domain-containing protein (putative c-di-GMP-specific phosphodiesterase class I)